MDFSKVEQTLKQTMRTVENFPKEGISFIDITPIFKNPEVYNLCLNAMVEQVQSLQLDAIAGIESRGFLFGFALAQRLNLPFILIRKKGKLPAEKKSIDYALEYGHATIEVHIDEIKQDQKILIHDDLLATGGTVIAAKQLLESLGAKIIGFNFIIVLEFLNARQKISEQIFTLTKY